MHNYVQGIKPDATEMVPLTNILKAHPAYKLEKHMEILRSHDKIIEVYDSHLGLDGWPQDPPVAQTITSYGKHHVNGAFSQSHNAIHGWNSQYLARDVGLRTTSHMGA
jgi:hypothetical protein